VKRRAHGRTAHVAGKIVVVSAGLFGAYVSGFYDGVRNGERMGDHTRRS
jgi:hypothetical protein